MGQLKRLGAADDEPSNSSPGKAGLDRTDISSDAFRIEVR
jgi:hypothetical protein